jgi:DNA-damage-inducible protein J
MTNLKNVIKIKIDSKDKELATNILKDLGLDMNTAINMFIQQIIKTNGIPFEIKNQTPNKELIEAIKESKEIINNKIEAKSYNNIKEMFEDVLND